MEPHQQHENRASRQSSTRWSATADQIRILRELYYNNGIRSPTAEQIERITERLRQYGKIEEKNVFYWFQNHKARERQKRRFTSNLDLARGVVGGRCKVEAKCNGYSGWNGGSSSQGVRAVGQLESIGCGSVHMENSFRDFSLTGSCSEGGTFESSYGFLDNRNSEESERDNAEIKTLQLFPMQDEETSGFCSEKSSGDYISEWYFDDEGKRCYKASLELSLSSYSVGGFT